MLLYFTVYHDYRPRRIVKYYTELFYNHHITLVLRTLPPNVLSSGCKVKCTPMAMSLYSFWRSVLLRYDFLFAIIQKLVSAEAKVCHEARHLYGKKLNKKLIVVANDWVKKFMHKINPLLFISVWESKKELLLLTPLFFTPLLHFTIISKMKSTINSLCSECLAFRFS